MTPIQAMIKIIQIENAIKDLHFALDNRKHGGVASHNAISRIEDILGLPWIQQQEKIKREEGDTP